MWTDWKFNEMVYSSTITVYWKSDVPIQKIACDWKFSEIHTYHKNILIYPISYYNLIYVNFMGTVLTTQGPDMAF